jgi:hypothetical protein
MGQTREDAFALYRRCTSSGVADYLQKQALMKIRRSIYTAQVAIWPMILPVEALSIVFRGKFVDGLRKASTQSSEKSFISFFWLPFEIGAVPSAEVT